jgi:hypothetical protein
MDQDKNNISNNSFKNIPTDIKIPEQDDKSTDTVQSEQYEMPSINNPNAVSIFIQDTQPIELHQKTEEEFIKILRSIQGLTDIQIRIIEVRYLSILRKYRERVKVINIIYHFIRLFVSLGGVAVPALLSIQTPNSPSSVPLFWFTWFISLSVTILHNISNIFRFDKKYFGINSTIDKLSSEGWQYLELSGKYTSHHPHPPATHANQYQLFVNTIEKIKGKQSESEFNFSMETDNKEKTSGPHSGVEQTNSTTVPVQKSPL